MAEERQSQRPTQPDGRHQQSGGQQSSGQSTQVIQSRGGAQQTGMARREGSMPSMFAMDPFEMLRISPFSLMRRFTEDMDQYFAQLGMGRGGQGTAAGSGLFVPPVEVVERDGTLTVRADLPGMTKDDIRVDMTENILTIEGERRAEHKEKQDGVVHSERRYGMFRRQIALPEGVNAEQATANFKDGVLEVKNSRAAAAGAWPSDRHSKRRLQRHGGSGVKWHRAQGVEQPGAGSGAEYRTRREFLGLRVRTALPAANLPR